MGNFISNEPKKLILVSISSFVVALLMLVSVGFAWITLSNKASGSFVSSVGNVDADFAFYVYLDESKNGSTNPTIANECASSSGDGCYYLIENTSTPLTEPVYLFGGANKVFPNDKFSFAIRVTNIGDFDSYLTLDFLDLISQGFDITDNKIQVAFSYEVTKITYLVSGVESSDIKSSLGIILHQDHFTKENDERYHLVESVPISSDDENTKTVIVYFDIYFDPLVFGYTLLGQPMNNSNAFENQLFTISKLAVILTKQ